MNFKSINKHFGLPLLGMLMLAAPAVTADTDVAAIVVLGNDGSRQEYALSDVDRINFTDDAVAVTVKEGEQPAPVAYGDVDRILLNSTLSGILSAMADREVAVWPTVTTGAVNIMGAEPGTVYRVYTAGGSLALSGKTGQGQTVADLSGLPAGVCVLTLGNQSVKIIKK